MQGFLAISIKLQACRQKFLFAHDSDQGAWPKLFSTGPRARMPCQICLLLWGVSRKTCDAKHKPCDRACVGPPRLSPAPLPPPRRPPPAHPPFFIYVSFFSPTGQMAVTQWDSRNLANRKSPCHLGMLLGECMVVTEVCMVLTEVRYLYYTTPQTPPLPHLHPS